MLAAAVADSRALFASEKLHWSSLAVRAPMAERPDRTFKIFCTCHNVELLGLWQR